MVDVRVIHDGTTGVRLNNRIKVRDAGTSPIHSDLKAVMRRQAARRTPRFGLTVDAEGAHKIVRVRPHD